MLNRYISGQILHCSRIFYKARGSFLFVALTDTVRDTLQPCSFHIACFNVCAFFTALYDNCQF